MNIMKKLGMVLAVGLVVAGPLMAADRSNAISIRFISKKQRAQFGFYTVVDPETKIMRMDISAKRPMVKDTLVAWYRQEKAKSNIDALRFLNKIFVAPPTTILSDEAFAADMHYHIARIFSESDPDDDGETPLTSAVKEKDAEGIAFLLNNGADPKIPNNSGELPLELAETRSYKLIATQLRAKLGLSLGERNTHAAAGAGAGPAAPQPDVNWQAQIIGMKNEQSPKKGPGPKTPTKKSARHKALEEERERIRQREEEADRQRALRKLEKEREEREEREKREAILRKNAELQANVAALAAYELERTAPKKRWGNVDEDETLVERAIAESQRSALHAPQSPSHASQGASDFAKASAAAKAKADGPLDRGAISPKPRGKQHKPVWQPKPKALVADVGAGAGAGAGATTSVAKPLYGEELRKQQEAERAAAEEQAQKAKQLQEEQDSLKHQAILESMQSKFEAAKKLFWQRANAAAHEAADTALRAAVAAVGGSLPSAHTKNS